MYEFEVLGRVCSQGSKMGNCIVTRMRCNRNVGALVSRSSRSSLKDLVMLCSEIAFEVFTVLRAVFYAS